MAWFAPTCAACGGFADGEGAGASMRFVGISRVTPPPDHGFGARFECGGCGRSVLDAFSLPPLAPERGACLACGGALAGGKCVDCGVSDPWLTSTIDEGLEGHDSLHKEVQGMLSRGLLRLALHMLGGRLRDHPEDVEAWSGKADLLADLAVHDQAADAYRRALDGGAGDGLRLKLANAERKAGRLEAAIEGFEAFLATAPAPDQVALANLLLGHTYEAQRAPKAAEAAYRRALEVTPEDAELHMHLAGTLAAQGRWEDTLHASEAGLAVSDPAPGVHRALLIQQLQALCSLRRAKAAVDAADAALVVRPGDPDIEYEKGRAYGLMGQLETCREVMQGILTRHPGHPNAARAVAQLDASSVH